MSRGELSLECREMLRGIAQKAEEDRGLLRAWVEQNSGSDNLAGLKAFRDLVRQRARSLPVDGKEWYPEGFEGDSGKAACALQWSRQRNDRARLSILLNGHLDTVYAADHPFQRVTELDSTRWKGPGIADMKGGVVILFRALEAFLTTSRGDALDWEILLTSDEETGSQVGEQWLGPAAKRHDFGITFEPSMPGGALVRNRMGVGMFQVHAQGKAAHTGRDFHAGRNACAALARFLSAVHDLNEKISGALLNVGQFQSVGPLNVVPDQATAGISIRVRDEGAQSAAADALEGLRSRTEGETGCALTLTGGFLRPPKVADTRVEKLFRAWQTVGASLGETLTWQDTGGTSDGNLLQAAGLPLIDNFGVIGGNLHSPEEWAEVSSLTTRAQLVAAFLYAAAGGELDLPRR
jgi:glutamate carboxypeptidase